ncbi:MAG: hypothetical protein KDE31_37645 [Caldilineaceae bacterium]|nr:hypothetical protein [Caldilineaceae bacterium]
MVAEPPIFTPIPTPTVIPSPTTVPPLELPNVPVPEGGQMYLLTPMQAEVVGWAREADEEINHFGDFNIFAGNFEGQQHVGAMQFDLTTIPVGSPILYADLTMTGLADEWLGSDGTWSVELLAEWMDRDWPTRNFHWLNRPDSALAALDPVMSAGELAVGRAHHLEEVAFMGMEFPLDDQRFDVL